MTGLSLRQEGVARVATIDRPASKNAISRALAAALQEALGEAAEDRETRAVIVTSADPKVFLSGGDLVELTALPLDDRGAEAVLALGALADAIEGCELPVIAAVEGAVFGGGSELCMACDLLVLGDEATLCFVHGKMGLVPAWGGTTRLVERVGATRAADLLLTARRVDAELAWSLGLCARRAARGAAFETAQAVAEEIARLDRDAVTRLKRSLLAARRARRGPALAEEQTQFRQAWGSEAHRAAFAAFLRRKS
ncbi:MAG: enoyl-CoA hydratase/isomerase family protein [Polyangiaceae bacterium]